ncbi:zinc metalloproteinase-disintegrin-like 8 isoform X2 [Kryptolebias marmoratus]|uniref:zinc metalloproteinase-disintegrin-like 8 isoform X2 n=1 Tax=Kryptolebias marmoratus TaxID=37003 RepID=UPI0007F8F653|nr:zinc metalloproteinase-disintegrin-like 8 isoform X2 [Kryptolebias marmoratus]
MFPLWLFWAGLELSSGLLSHAQNYEVVRPRRRPERRTRSLQIYPDEVQYDLTVGGRNLTVQLEKNWNLLGENYTETYYSEDGKRVTTTPTQEFCFYHGRVAGEADSSVSVGICSGLSGFLTVRQQLYRIEPLGRTDGEEHAVYKQERPKVSGRPGSGSRTSRLYDQNQNPQPAGLLGSSSSKTKRLSAPQRFVELFVVADNTEYQRYGEQTTSRILGVVNHIDKLYRALNIRVILVGLEVWSYRDYISVDPKPETTLDHFLAWRKADLLPRVKHDNAQFVTGRVFGNDTVGLANKFAMCTENSGGVNQDHQENLLGLASTVAHEMGHNLGLSHDAAGCVCGPMGSSDCVMTEKLRPEGQAFPEFFSGCSEQQLSDFMERAQPGCLHRPVSVRTVAPGPSCGNALLDPGEDCDCGTEEECQNPCCDATTCRLTAGSQCADGLCCESCQVKASGSVCRESAGVCDLPEFCTGQSPECPEDSFQMNGEPCLDQAGFCYNGRCPTREQHCWRLFGEGAKVGPDLCFNLNKRGEEDANCGRGQSGVLPCSAADVKCGSAFCVGGGESITGKRSGYTVFSLECKLSVENDRTRNIDMVPNGTKCGPNKVCLGSRCVDVSVYGRKEDCAKKCNNNGVCDHRKLCHCDAGWAPPNCDTKYSDLPPAQNVAAAAVAAALSSLLVMALLIAGLMCCRRSSYARRRRRTTSPPGRLTPTFQRTGVRDRPEISQPTLMESTANQACSPLVVPVSPRTPAPQIKPVPPLKPLPPANKPQVKGVRTSPPPEPGVKLTPPPEPRVKLTRAPEPPVKPSPPPEPPVKPSPPPESRVKLTPPPDPRVKLTPAPGPPPPPRRPAKPGPLRPEESGAPRHRQV